MVDWATDGLHDGFQLSEWVQPNGHHALHNPQHNFKGGIQAFCIEDVEFFTYKKVGVPTAEITHLSPNDPLVGRDMWRYRTQKNNQNNKKCEHARNPYVVTPFHITSTVRIVQRFSCLIGANHRNVPLRVCRHANGQVRCITASIIKSTFRMAAAHVYKLDPVKDCEHLRKWSSHSLRVGVCVILHGMGFTDLQIKLLLRWRSDAFSTT
jgi:hypothetical protein